MAEETNALRDAKYGGGLYLTDFPCKIRVLTRDPMVYTDKFANTRYAFAVYNLDLDKVMILNKGPGFSQRFGEIDADPDFGEDVRKVDIKITTNGKSGIEVRYTITPVGSPSELPKEAVKTIVANGFDLAEKIKENNPAALRLSEINAGAKVPEAEDQSLEPNQTDPEDVVIEDIPDDINKIPF